MSIPHHPPPGPHDPAGHTGPQNTWPQPPPQHRPLRAVPNPSEAGTSVGARARIEQPLNPALNPPSQPLVPVGTDPPAEVMQTPAVPNPLERLKSWASPPDVRREPPPTWEQLKWRAEGGDQVARDGWTRTAALAYTKGVALPVRALLVWLDWIVRVPSRAAVALLIYSVLAHLGPFTWLPWPGFLP